MKVRNKNFSNFSTFYIIVQFLKIWFVNPKLIDTYSTYGNEIYSMKNWDFINLDWSTPSVQKLQSILLKKDLSVIIFINTLWVSFINNVHIQSINLYSCQFEAIKYRAKTLLSVLKMFFLCSLL